MIGKRLIFLRNNCGLTQDELAKALSMSRSTYAQYEVNRRNPDYETLHKIADYFGVTTDYLLGRTEDLGLHQKEHSHTIAAHRTDDSMADLPEEARKSVEEFMEYIRRKYGKGPSKE